MPSDPDFDRLIPEMRDWNNGGGIDVAGWISCTGNFRLAVAYSTIFWPRFVEFEGYVLRDGFSVESLRAFEAKSSGDRKGVESVMNHLYLGNLQHAFCEDKTSERFVYLGRVLKEIYEAKLAWQFPNRRFEVCFDDSECEDLWDYQLTFFQSEGLAHVSYPN